MNYRHIKNGKNYCNSSRRERKRSCYLDYPKDFDTVEEANEFIEKVSDLESKYWTYAGVVENGEKIEPYYGEFY